MKKPRSDAKLLNLPEDQAEALNDWLLANAPYREVKKRLADQFGVETSMGALSLYYNEYIGPALIAKRHRAVSTAEEIATAAAAKPGMFDQATIDAIKQKAFELSISPRSSPGDVKSLFMLVLKSRDQDLKSQDIEIKLRRLEMMEQQLADARRVLEGARGGSVDPQALADEMDRILGRKS